MTGAVGILSVERVRHPLEARLLEVRAVERLTAGMRRIGLTGDVSS